MKLVGGPMDGAVYALSRDTQDPGQRSTNRKPDGLWFDGIDEHGRNVQHPYRNIDVIVPVNCVSMIYKYIGQVVDTGIEMETEEPS